MAGPLSEQFLRSVALQRDRVPDFDVYPFAIPSIRHLDTLDFDPGVTFLIGENGSGKSTLLEALAVALRCNPEGGSPNFNFSTRDSHSQLHGVLKIVRGVRRPRDIFFLRAESYFNVATAIEDYKMVHAYGGVSLHDQSHGESFLALLSERFGADGLYLLDEPEAALSPSRQLAVLRLLDDLVRRRTQFVIATHSPILLAFPGARIYALSENGIAQTAYEDTEHYRVTRDFLNHREAALEELLRDELSGQGRLF